MKLAKFLPALLFSALLFAGSYSIGQGEMDFQSRRQKVINEMNSLIEEKVQSGEYDCCIKPACDMCFLGHWIFEDGICHCDEYIAKGEYDKVCPQCKNKISDLGACESAQH